ncbi:MAG TPA: restriction endonuclease subunit M [Fibrobacteres bacterium]|jgi:hypothetical protein|nr:restriction endonuclease subunit M [Fibrobacterota bacterium]
MTENADLDNESNQVISKKRVSDHGEVFTAKREVNAMLDLVKQETERMESRFLEPACGAGNFVAEILVRKLNVVESKYGKSQLEYERYAVLAISSIYGIDILKDNVDACRERLFVVFDEQYTKLFKDTCKKECRDSIKFILSKNIVWGDALTLTTVCDKKEPIVFPEWSPVNGSMIKRRDFAFHALISSAHNNDLPLFSDLGEDAFIPEPVKEYPLAHFLRISDVE